MLIDTNRLADILPDPTESLDLQLNALMRLGVYFALIMLLVGNIQVAVFTLITVSVFTYAIYERPGESFFDSRKDICRRPEKENIFMNPLIFDDPSEPAACDVQDPGTRRSMDHMFNESMYRDVDDVFHAHSAHRQFYTMPSTTVPNDQTQFAKFLYPGVVRPLR